MPESGFSLDEVEDDGVAPINRQALMRFRDVEQPSNGAANNIFVIDCLLRKIDPEELDDKPVLKKIDLRGSALTEELEFSQIYGVRGKTE